MKKIITALVALLLLASVPVHAVGWAPEPPEAVPPCTIGISLYEYSQTVQLGGGYYKPFSGEAQKGTMLRALIAVHIPEGVDVSRLTIEIAATGFEITEAPALTLAGGKNEFLLAGYLTQSAATIKAALKYKGLSVEELPRVSVMDGVITVDRLGFVTDSKGQITDLLYDGQPLGRTLAGALDLSDAEAKDLNETLSYLGFKLGSQPCGYMSRELIEKYLGGAWEMAAQAKIGAATTITGPAAAGIPQTGSYGGAVVVLFLGSAAALAFKRRGEG